MVILTAEPLSLLLLLPRLMMMMFPIRMVSLRLACTVVSDCADAAIQKTTPANSKVSLFINLYLMMKLSCCDFKTRNLDSVAGFDICFAFYHSFYFPDKAADLRPADFLFIHKKNFIFLLFLLQIVH